MLKDYRFHFRPVLTFFSLLALGVLIALGTWQLQRLEWKRDLIAKVEARIGAEPIPFEQALARAEAGEDMEYTPVVVDGRWRTVEGAAVFGTYEGHAGAFIFAPFFYSENKDDAVYVNVGYVPSMMAKWPSYFPLYADVEEIKISGLFRTREDLQPPALWFRPKGKSADGLWFVRDPLIFAAEAGVEAPAYYIDQFAVPDREWPKGGTTRLDFNNRHLEYALTWFGLALTLLVVWVAFFLQKR